MKGRDDAAAGVTIGLEIHCQLTALKTKLFCGCSSDYRGREPNELICPVCFGLPGTLPVLNAKAVEYAIRIADAVGCKVAAETTFYRKNYFYPDLSKNFQISQYAKAGGVHRLRWLRPSRWEEGKGPQDPARGGPGEAYLPGDDREVVLQPCGLQTGLGSRSSR